MCGACPLFKIHTCTIERRTWERELMSRHLKLSNRVARRSSGPARRAIFTQTLVNFLSRGGYFWGAYAPAEAACERRAHRIIIRHIHLSIYSAARIKKICTHV